MAAHSFPAHHCDVKQKHFPKIKMSAIPMDQNMKHNHNHDNAPITQLVPVRFEFTHPTAKTVCLAGTFNHWQPEAKTLHTSGVGNWWKEMFLAPGIYEYCLVVDGKWIPDPLARETVANPFGGRNSILKVASSPEAAHRADAQNLPLKNAIKQKTQKI
jgi:1,4-alpha-glucan branching enzyme